MFEIIKIFFTVCGVLLVVAAIAGLPVLIYYKLIGE